MSLEEEIAGQTDAIAALTVQLTALTAAIAAQTPGGGEPITVNVTVDTPDRRYILKRMPVGEHYLVDGNRVRFISDSEGGFLNSFSLPIIEVQESEGGGNLFNEATAIQGFFSQRT